MTPQLVFEGEKMIMGKNQKIRITRLWGDNDVMVRYATTVGKQDPVEVLMSSEGRWVEKGGKETQLANEIGALMEELMR